MLRSSPIWVSEAWPVSRMNRIVLACQTASQVLGIDCQSAMPRAAVNRMNSAPMITPVATQQAWSQRGRGPLTGGFDASPYESPQTCRGPDDEGDGKRCQQPFHGTPRAPNGPIAVATAP